MGAHDNAPIIIKRKKKVSGDGHHGGAWKVAYADFVTAMMAFFMLMWLLNATTEQQRTGIADYFAPTIALSNRSGGGDGVFGGESLFTQETLSQNGTGGAGENTGGAAMLSGEAAAQTAALRDMEETLLGKGGESALSEKALRHVVTRLTDEGLIIEVFDVPGVPLFIGESDAPTPIMQEISAMLARVLVLVENKIAVTGHLAAQSVVRLDNPVWGLSTARAGRVRLLLEAGGLDPARVERLTGTADRQPAVSDGTAIRNNRIEVTVLRSDPLN